MQLFSNYSKNNNCNLSLKNSIIFSLYHKNLNKEFYFKSNNLIKGFYKDSILDDNIYFASNGLKKNSVFSRKQLNSTILKPTANKFVSYFSNIEDNFLIFNIYPHQYFINTVNDFLNDQKIVTNWKSKNNKNNSKNSFFFKNFKLLHNTGNFNNGNTLNRSILIKNSYDKFYFVNNTGYITETNSLFFSKNLFTGLFFIFPKNIQNLFKNTLVLNYSLLLFFSNISKLKNSTKSLFSNILIYTYFFKYLNFQIYKYFKQKKLKVRKSNILLYRYIKSYLLKFNKVIDFLYIINYKNYLNNNNQQLWIKNFLFTNNRIKKSIIWQKIQTLDTNTQLLFLNKILTILPIHSSYNIIQGDEKNLINSYINVKSLTINNLLLSNSIYLNLYKNKNVTSYLDDLSINKIIKLNSTLYPIDSNYLYNNLINHQLIYENNSIATTQTFNYKFLDLIESPNFNLILKFNKILSQFYLINNTFFKPINSTISNKRMIKQFKKHIRLLKKILKKVKKRDKKFNKNRNNIINHSKIIKLKTIKYLIIMKLILFKNSIIFKNKKI